MRNLYNHHFALKPGTRVYIPSMFGAQRGREIKETIERLWRPPDNYYHLLDGGHVAAVRSHRDAPWLASLDLQRFFEQISRSKVHRALKAIGFSQREAWEMACDSTVDKRPPQRKFSLPFGFVQSPIVASVVLAKSALGGEIRKLCADGSNVTVYVDDITVSGRSEQEVSSAVDKLEAAAALSGFSFNPEKSQPASRRVSSFNIQFGSGIMDIVDGRMAEFEVAVRNGNEYQVGGILGYVTSVNADQAEKLAEALPGQPFEQSASNP